MTPNPNPSPELREAVEKLTRPIIGMENRTSLEVRDILFDRIRSHFAALSPPPTITETVTVALPAPGEVEANLEAQRQAIEACARIADIHAEPTDTPGDFTKGYEVAAGKIARSIRKLCPNASLATVAAANDEGVARIIDPAVWDEAEQYRVRADEWFAKGRTTPGDCLTDGYREKADAMQAPLLAKAAAIRLLSQGGGK